MCGCEDGGQDLNFLDGHVWVVHVCTRGQFCVSGQIACLAVLPGVLRPTTISRTKIALQIDAEQGGHTVGITRTTDVKFYAAGVPGQRQDILFQHCLPYNIGTSSVADAVVTRCGAKEVSLDSDGQSPSSPSSTVSLPKLELETQQQDGQVIVRGELAATITSNFNSGAPKTIDPQSGHVKLVSLVCSMGGQQSCDSDSSGKGSTTSPLPFAEIHRAYYAPREVTTNIIGGNRPFIFVHNLGVDFSCAQSTYVITCIASLHYSARGHLRMGLNGCPLRDGTENLVRYVQHDASFSCMPNRFSLKHSTTNPVDPMYIFQYKKLTMHLDGYADTPTLLTNSSQLLARAFSLATLGGGEAQTGISEISMVGNGIELLKMKPVFIDIAMGRETKFTLLNSAIVGHLSLPNRALYGPVDINALRQEIPSTVYYAAGIKGWWSVKLKNAPDFHWYKDTRVLLELLTEGESDLPLSNYDEIRVWISPALPSDRPELVQGNDPVLRQEFDDAAASWYTPTNYCEGSNPCQNGGICVSRTTFFTCKCPEMFAGFTCEYIFLATQKTTFDSATEAQKAIDGNLNTMAHSKSTEEGETNPWWKLDMQKEMRVRLVTVTNRKTCGISGSCDDRIVGAKVIVGNVDDIWDDNNVQCGGKITSSVGGQIHFFVCSGISGEDGEVRGRYIFVLLPGTGKILNFAELKPFFKNNDPLHGALLLNGNCVNNNAPCNLAELPRMPLEYKASCQCAINDLGSNGNPECLDSRISCEGAMSSDFCSGGNGHDWHEECCQWREQLCQQKDIYVNKSYTDGTTICESPTTFQECVNKCAARNMFVPSTEAGIRKAQSSGIDNGNGGCAYASDETWVSPQHDAMSEMDWRMTASSQAWSVSSFGPLSQSPSGVDGLVMLGGVGQLSMWNIPGIDGLNVPKVDVGIVQDGATFSFWWMWVSGDEWTSSRARPILEMYEENESGKIVVSMDELVSNSLRIDVVLSSRYERHLRTTSNFFDKKDKWIHIVVRIGALQTHPMGEREIGVFVDAQPISYILLDVLPVVSVNVNTDLVTNPDTLEKSTRVRTVAMWYKDGNRGFEPSFLFGSDLLCSCNGRMEGSQSLIDLTITFELWDVDAQQKLDVSVEASYEDGGTSGLRIRLDIEDDSGQITKEKLSSQNSGSISMSVGMAKLQKMGGSFTLAIKLTRKDSTDSHYKNVDYNIQASSGVLIKKSGSLDLNITEGGDEHLQSMTLTTTALPSSQPGPTCFSSTQPPYLVAGGDLLLPPTKTVDHNWESQNGPRFSAVSSAELDHVGTASTYLEKQLNGALNSFSICMWIRVDNINDPNAIFSLHHGSPSPSGIKCEFEPRGTDISCQSSSDKRSAPTVTTFGSPGNTASGSRNYPWPWRPFSRVEHRCPEGFTDIESLGISAYCQTKILNKMAGPGSGTIDLARTTTLEECKRNGRAHSLSVNAIQFGLTAGGIVPEQNRSDWVDKDVWTVLDDFEQDRGSWQAVDTFSVVSVEKSLYDNGDGPNLVQWTSILPPSPNDYNQGDGAISVFISTIVPVSRNQHDVDDTNHVFTTLIVQASNPLVDTVNIVEENSTGVGRWEGTCTCIDGSVYIVGNTTKSCGTLACNGGVVGESCVENTTTVSNASYPFWGRSVTCGNTQTDTDAFNVLIQHGPASTVLGNVGGGTCTCPDGTMYTVADNNDNCASLACVGGTSGTCSSSPHNWSKLKVICGAASTVNDAGQNVPQSPVPGAGRGSCTCSDGVQYEVHDTDGTCTSLNLNCEHGTVGSCEVNGASVASRKKVICSSTTTTSHGPNVVQVFASTTSQVSEYGGTCTCPDGSIYQVADNNDNCGSLACVGGNSGSCTVSPGPWSFRKVICASAATMDAANNIIQNAVVPGSGGGSCTCVDGTTYQVGDNGDDCGSLACNGGVTGTCTLGLFSLYRTITSGDCISNDLSDIRTQSECGTAGISLGVTQTYSGMPLSGGNRTKFCGTHNQMQFLNFNDPTKVAETWKVAAVIDGNAATWHYNSDMWTNETVFDHGVEKKTLAFVDQPSNKIRVTFSDNVNVNGGCTRTFEYEHNLNMPLREIFAGPERLNISPGLTKWNYLGCSGFSYQNYCNKHGFNVQGGLNTKARFGILFNSETNCDTPDTAIGIGIDNDDIPIAAGGWARKNSGLGSSLAVIATVEVLARGIPLPGVEKTADSVLYELKMSASDNQKMICKASNIVRKRVVCPATLTKSNFANVVVKYGKGQTAVGMGEGTCLCPDGMQYMVANSDSGNNECNSLSCENGISGTTCTSNSYSSSTVARQKVVCGISITEKGVPGSEQVVAAAAFPGDRQGLCTCEDGMQYTVASKENNCDVLSCNRGYRGGCNMSEAAYHYWPRQTVECSNTVTNVHGANVKVQSNPDSPASNSSGSCVCPDENRYWTSEAGCINGTFEHPQWNAWEGALSGTSVAIPGPWLHRSVVCGNRFTESLAAVNELSVTQECSTFDTSIAHSALCSLHFSNAIEKDLGSVRDESLEKIVVVSIGPGSITTTVPFPEGINSLRNCPGSKLFGDNEQYSISVSNSNKNIVVTRDKFPPDMHKPGLTRNFKITCTTEDMHSNYFCFGLCLEQPSTSVRVSLLQFGSGLVKNEVLYSRGATTMTRSYETVFPGANLQAGSAAGGYPAPIRTFDDYIPVAARKNQKLRDLDAKLACQAHCDQTSGCEEFWVFGQQPLMLKTWKVTSNGCNWNETSSLCLQQEESTAIQYNAGESATRGVIPFSDLTFAIFDHKTGKLVTESDGKMTSASMSSIYSSDGYFANNVIDGNDNTFCHTSSGNNEWLRVNINPASLMKVKITNRKDGSQQRLGTFDLKFQGLDYDWHVCNGSPYTYNIAGPLMQSFACVTKVQARAIEIKQHNKDYLNLAEVKVITEYSALWTTSSLMEALKSLPSGTILAVTVHDTAVPLNEELPSAVLNLLKMYGSSGRQVGYRESFAMVGVKGSSPGSAMEEYGSVGTSVSVLRIIDVTPKLEGRCVLKGAATDSMGSSLVTEGVGWYMRKSWSPSELERSCWVHDCLQAPSSTTRLKLRVEPIDSAEVRLDDVIQSWEKFPTPYHFNEKCTAIMEMDTFGNSSVDFQTVYLSDRALFWKDAVPFAGTKPGVVGVGTAVPSQEFFQFDFREVYESCSKVPTQQSGAYKINPLNEDGKFYNVICDFGFDETAVGADASLYPWTIFQRRVDSSGVSFQNQEWQDYKQGFGDTTKNFWSGLEFLRAATTAGPLPLRIGMCDGSACESTSEDDMTKSFIGVDQYAVYQQFEVGSEADKYRLLVSGFENQQQNCQVNYLLQKTKRTWSASETACTALGTTCHLVSIHSAEENQIVLDMISGSTWIGLNDVSKEGTWVHTDGTPVDYKRWHSGEPNNYLNNEDYGMMYSDGTWNDGNNPNAGLESVCKCTCNYFPGDSLSYSNGEQFSTKDKDNDDSDSDSCAVKYRSGWWHKSCHESNPNGKYGDNSYGVGIVWTSYQGYENSLERFEMAISTGPWVGLAGDSEANREIETLHAKEWQHVCITSSLSSSIASTTSVTVNGKQTILPSSVTAALHPTTTSKLLIGQSVPTSWHTLTGPDDMCYGYWRTKNSNGPENTYMGGWVDGKVWLCPVTEICECQDWTYFGGTSHSFFPDPSQLLNGRISRIGFWKRTLTMQEIRTDAVSQTYATAKILLNPMLSWDQVGTNQGLKQVGQSTLVPSIRQSMLLPFVRTYAVTEGQTCTLNAPTPTEPQNGWKSCPGQEDTTDTMTTSNEDCFERARTLCDAELSCKGFTTRWVPDLPIFNANEPIKTSLITPRGTGAPFKDIGERGHVRIEDLIVGLQTVSPTKLHVGFKYRAGVGFFARKYGVHVMCSLLSDTGPPRKLWETKDHTPLLDFSLVSFNFVSEEWRPGKHIVRCSIQDFLSAQDVGIRGYRANGHASSQQSYWNIETASIDTSMKLALCYDPADVTKSFSVDIGSSATGVKYVSLEDRNGVTCPSVMTNSHELRSCDGGRFDRLSSESCPPDPRPPLVNLVNLEEEGTDLDNCQGDCDSDTECKKSFVCQQRNNEPVRGCSGVPTSGWDYCYDNTSQPMFWAADQVETFSATFSIATEGGRLKVTRTDAHTGWEVLAHITCTFRKAASITPLALPRRTDGIIALSRAQQPTTVAEMLSTKRETSWVTNSPTSATVPVPSRVAVPLEASRVNAVRVRSLCTPRSQPRSLVVHFNRTGQAIRSLTRMSVPSSNCRWLVFQLPNPIIVDAIQVNVLEYWDTYLGAETHWKRECSGCRAQWDATNATGGSSMALKACKNACEANSDCHAINFVTGSFCAILALPKKVSEYRYQGINHESPLNPEISSSDELWIRGPLLRGFEEIEIIAEPSSAGFGSSVQFETSLGRSASFGTSIPSGASGTSKILSPSEIGRRIVRVVPGLRGNSNAWSSVQTEWSRKGSYGGFQSIQLKSVSIGSLTQQTAMDDFRIYDWSLSDSDVDGLHQGYHRIRWPGPPAGSVECPHEAPGSNLWQCSGALQDEDILIVEATSGVLSLKSVQAGVLVDRLKGGQVFFDGPNLAASGIPTLDMTYQPVHPVPCQEILHKGVFVRTRNERQSGEMVPSYCGVASPLDMTSWCAGGVWSRELDVDGDRMADELCQISSSTGKSKFRLSSSKACTESIFKNTRASSDAPSFYLPPMTDTKGAWFLNTPLNNISTLSIPKNRRRGFTTQVSASNRRVIRKGSGGPLSRAQCSDKTEQHAVRCCTTSGAGVSNDATSGPFGCKLDATFAEALTFCIENGHRLCTDAEVASTVTVGTGCGFDSRKVWTSNTCKISCDHPLPSMNGPTYPWGCAGANSQSQCINNSGEHEWWEACCQWDEQSRYSWQLAAVIDGSQSTWNYNNAVWTNRDSFDNGVEKKTSVFVDQPSNKIRITFEHDGGCTKQFDYTHNLNLSLRDIFASDSLVNKSPGRDAWISLGCNNNFKTEPTCNKQGFNIQAGSENQIIQARFGIIFDTTSACNSPHTAIGIGFDNLAAGGFATNVTSSTNVVARIHILTPSILVKSPQCNPIDSSNTWNQHASSAKEISSFSGPVELKQGQCLIKTFDISGSKRMDSNETTSAVRFSMKLWLLGEWTRKERSYDLVVHVGGTKLWNLQDDLVCSALGNWNGHLHKDRFSDAVQLSRETCYIDLIHHTVAMLPLLEVTVCRTSISNVRSTFVATSETKIDFVGMDPVQEGTVTFVGDGTELSVLDADRMDYFLVATPRDTPSHPMFAVSNTWKPVQPFQLVVSNMPTGLKLSINIERTQGPLLEYVEVSWARCPVTLGHLTRAGSSIHDTTESNGGQGLSICREDSDVMRDTGTVMWHELGTICCDDRNMQIEATVGSGNTCELGNSWQEANQHCLGLGLRLCTDLEIQYDYGADTGCNHNQRHMWTSTQCLVEACDEEKTAVLVAAEEAGAWKSEEKRTFELAVDSVHLPTKVQVRFCSTVFGCSATQSGWNVGSLDFYDQRNNVTSLVFEKKSGKQNWQLEVSVDAVNVTSRYAFPTSRSLVWWSDIDKDMKYTMALFVGCFTTSDLNRLFHTPAKKYMPTDYLTASHSVRSCSAICRSSGFAFCAVTNQNDKWCTCSQNYVTGLLMIAPLYETQCGNVCASEENIYPPHYCGTKSASAIYRSSVMFDDNIQHHAHTTFGIPGMSIPDTKQFECGLRDADITGFVMYTQSDVLSRFGSSIPDPAEHLVCIYYEINLNQWFVDTGETNGFKIFTPRKTDFLIASVSQDHVLMYEKSVAINDPEIYQYETWSLETSKSALASFQYGFAQNSSMDLGWKNSNSSIMVAKRTYFNRFASPGQIYSGAKHLFFGSQNHHPGNTHLSTTIMPQTSSSSLNGNDGLLDLPAALSIQVASRLCVDRGPYPTICTSHSRINTNKANILPEIPLIQTMVVTNANSASVLDRHDAYLKWRPIHYFGEEAFRPTNLIAFEVRIRRVSGPGADTCVARNNLGICTGFPTFDSEMEKSKVPQEHPTFNFWRQKAYCRYARSPKNMPLLRPTYEYVDDRTDGQCFYMYRRMFPFFLYIDIIFCFVEYSNTLLTLYVFVLKRMLSPIKV
jgi:hypothetical protein